MLRSFVLSAATALVLPLGLAHAGEQASPPMLHVEGYLDEAPANAEVTEQVRITRDGKDRVLYVVTARPATSDHPGRVFRDEENQELALRLDGPGASEIVKGDAGSKVEGTFLYDRGSHRLTVQNID